MVKQFTKQQKQRLDEIFAATSALPPFPADTPEKQQARRAEVTGEGWKAFSAFCIYYFPFIFKLAFCADHTEAFNYIEANRNGITGLTGFRGMGKTMLFAIAYVCWKIVKGEHYVIHNAANERLVRKRTELLYNQLTKNIRLLHDFPQLEVQEGDKLSFYLQNDTLIEGVGVDQDLRGSIHPRTGERPGLIVNDDIDRKKNIGNWEIGHRKLEAITQEQKGALDAGKLCRILWLGNLTHPNYAICQFEKLLSDRIKADDEHARPEDRKHLQHHKLLLLRFPLEDKQGNSRWEARYPTASLPEVRRDFGYTGYLREMMGKAVIEGYQFKFEWFHRWKTLPKRVKRVWLYADPARGNKGCYKAIVAIGWDGYHFYLLKVWVRQTKQSSYFRFYYDAYSELYRKYGAKLKAGMEANFKQDDIIEAFDRWCDDEGLVRIGHRIKRIYNYDDKDFAIEQTETVIENGKLLFPEGQDMETLVAQYLVFKAGQKTDKDGPDAVARCLKQFPAYGIKKRAKVRTVDY
jgi:hypothetical protein